MTPFEARTARINQAMSYRGMSRTRLAREAGVCRVTIYKILSGKWVGSETTLRAIARVLDIDTAELLLCGPLGEPSTTPRTHGITANEAALMRLRDLLSGDPDTAERLREAIGIAWHAQFNRSRPLTDTEEATTNVAATTTT